MKARKAKIPPESLVNRYLPADYSDAFVCAVGKAFAHTPDDLMVRFWTDFPRWVDVLFGIRNFFVRFVGLKGSMSSLREFEECIRTGGKTDIASVPAKNECETVLLLDDKHLSAYMSVYIEDTPHNKQVYATTLVHFKNRLGRVYFFFIRPFHGLLVGSILKRSVK